MTRQNPGADIPGTLLLDLGVLEDPYPFYERLRREAPMWQVPGTNVFVATSFDVIDEIVGRTDDFSNAFLYLLYRNADGLPEQYRFPRDVGGALVSADPPLHTQQRRAVFPALVAKRMAALEPEIEALARRLIADFAAASGGDFMDAVANALPIRVISDLIGFRDSDPDRLLQAAFDSTLMVAATHTLEDLQQLIGATDDIGVWVAEEILAGDAPDDVLRGTIAHAIERGDLDFVAGVAILHNLLSAGGESTTSLIGNATRILAEHPDLQNRLRADPALVPAFIEEVLRFESPFRMMMRSVPVDTTLRDVQVPAGATVLVFFSAANRDPAEYEDPDRIRLDREQPKSHLAFGRGVHHCVGAPLARLEGNIAITQLLAATSSMRLAPDAPPQRLQSLMVRRHETLHLTVQ